MEWISKIRFRNSNYPIKLANLMRSFFNRLLSQASRDIIKIESSKHLEYLQKSGWLYGNSLCRLFFSSWQNGVYGRKYSPQMAHDTVLWQKSRISLGRHELDKFFRLNSGDHELDVYFIASYEQSNRKTLAANLMEIIICTVYLHWQRMNK